MTLETKECPYCGNGFIASFKSLKEKYCTDCNRKLPWYLTPSIDVLDQPGNGGKQVTKDGSSNS